MIVSYMLDRVTGLYPKLEISLGPSKGLFCEWLLFLALGEANEFT